MTKTIQLHMQYRLSRPEYTEELSKILARSIKEQELLIPKATKKHLKELAEICQIIKKDGLPKYLVRVKLPGHLGHGIFLHPNAKPLVKGQIIGSYAGIVSLTPQNDPDDSAYTFAPLDNIKIVKEEQAIIDKKKTFHPRRLYSMNIDATDKGNFTRFINHSDKPNVMAELLKIPKNSLGLSPSPIEVIYLAKKTIRPGEQLLVSYEGEEDSYWGVLKITPIVITPKTFHLSPSLKLIGSVEKS